MASFGSREAPPYEVSMDPDSARQLAEHGGTLLCLHVAEHTCVGIDQQMFVVGPKFMGLKMIPPGTHFVYYCAVSRDGSERAPIIGFFTHFEPQQVIVRKWDIQEERLIPLEDESEEDRLISAVKRFEFDTHLGPYDLLSFKKWQRLSSFITPSVIDRLQPVGGDITVTRETEENIELKKQPSVSVSVTENGKLRVTRETEDNIEMKQSSVSVSVSVTENGDRKSVV